MASKIKVDEMQESTTGLGIKLVSPLKSSSGAQIISETGTLGSTITFPSTIDNTILGSNVKINYGTTSERPNSPTIGHYRYNTDFNLLEYYNGIGWLNPNNSYNPVQGDMTFEIDAKNPISYSTNHDTSNVRWKNLRHNDLNAINNGATYDATTKSFIFNGSSNFGISSLVGGYPFTVTAWVTHDTWDPGGGMDQLLNMSIGGQRVSLSITDGWVAEGEIALMYGGTNHWGTGYNSATMTANTWHNITWVVYGSNNSSHKIFLNNVSQPMNNRGGAHGGSAGWKLGGNYSSGEYWLGKIGYFAIYNSTLSDSQVSNIYNAMIGMYS